jgi:hypothetical protein
MRQWEVQNGKVYSFCVRTSSKYALGNFSYLVGSYIQLFLIKYVVDKAYHTAQQLKRWKQTLNKLTAHSRVLQLTEHSDSKDISGNLWNRKVHYRVHKIVPNEMQNTLKHALFCSEELLDPIQPPRWRTTSCRLSTIAYSI